MKRRPPAAAVPVLSSPLRNLVYGLLFLSVIIPAAVGGYMLAGWTFEDAFYMVIITVFSVGYEEVHPVDTPWLRLLTTTVIVLGCTGMIFLTGAVVQFFTAAQIQQMLGSKRMKSEIDHLVKHVIVCGFGRIGTMLARDLRAGRAPFVVIERDEKRAAEAHELGYLCIHGDSTDETVLKAAGVERAAVVASVLPDDAANVFITLSARALNRGLRIISRGEQPTTESKLLQAGADQVVLPAHIGAERIAELILFPHTSQLLRSTEQMRLFEHGLHGLGLELEVMPVAEQGEFTGRSVAEIEASVQGAFLIVAVNRADGSSVSRPPGELRLRPGDGVVVIGRSGRMNRVDAFAG
jgi:Trk K+ transport system NAD-binding subunit